MQVEKNPFPRIVRVSCGLACNCGFSNALSPPISTDDAAVAALGGKAKAERDTPYEYAALKRRFAALYSGAAAQNMMASAVFIESKAAARGIQKPAAGAGAGSK